MTDLTKNSAALDTAYSMPPAKVTGGDSDEFPLRDADRDALHIFPLALLPLETPSLRRARIIKNMRLDGVVELFHDPNTGSGQIEIQDIPIVLEWPNDKSTTDLDLLRRLVNLPSYDVYSLRILLREMDIPVSNAKGLSLSPAKVASLDNYMASFTRPLVATVFGEHGVDTGGAQDLVRMFRECDSSKVLGNLTTIANKLEIEVTDLPRFLEDCGDIFLALSYYRQCLDEIEPVVGGLLDAIEEIRGNRLLSENHAVAETCKMIESTIVGQMASVGGRVEKFDRLTGSLWDDVSAESFKEVRGIIRSYQVAVGGVLCALTVKMKAWATQFPNPATVGTKRLANFMMSDMKQGIEKIQRMEGMAPGSGHVLQ